MKRLDPGDVIKSTSLDRRYGFDDCLFVVTFTDMAGAYVNVKPLTPEREYDHAASDIDFWAVASLGIEPVLDYEIVGKMIPDVRWVWRK